MLRAYQSPASGSHCGPQWAHMPNLASRNHSGVWYWLDRDCQSGWNGPLAAGWLGTGLVCARPRQGRVRTVNEASSGVSFIWFFLGALENEVGVLGGISGADQADGE